MHKKRKIFLVFILVSLLAIFLVAINFSSFLEGIKFLYNGLTYSEISNNPINPNGKYGAIYDLVKIFSIERMEYIRKYLNSKNIDYKLIPNPGGEDNILVSNISNKDSYTLIVAHYDKYTEKEDYQGALDNAASVVVLLNLISDLGDKKLLPENVGFLFTGLEEKGILGSQYFVYWAKANNYKIKRAIVLDMIGRGNLMAMTPGVKNGLKFNIPFVAEILINFPPVINAKYWNIDNSIIDFKKYGIKTNNNVVTTSDASSFLLLGIPAAHLSSDNIWHILNVMHTNKDTIEKLDEKSLENAERILENYIQSL
ncbi:MAG: M20/M25/M40 family metallo-hydrolase [bacterium]|nr:M20/M25/M40 family metallo-hydrolase [bacterium]